MTKKQQKQSKKHVVSGAVQTSAQTVNIIPHGDRILIRETENHTEEKTVSGIILPASVQEDKGAKQGTVVAVGAGKFDDGEYVSPLVKTGDTVLFSWGTKIIHDDTTYYIVSENDILAYIPNK